MSLMLKNFIGGQWLAADDAAENRNPANPDDRIGVYARGGMVMVNLPTAGVDRHLPFGGRGQGRMAMDLRTSFKSACVFAG